MATPKQARLRNLRKAAAILIAAAAIGMIFAAIWAISWQWLLSAFITLILIPAIAPDKIEVEEMHAGRARPDCTYCRPLRGETR